MDDREKKGRRIADFVTLTGLLLLICFSCRLWPLILLMILGVFMAAIWLLARQMTEQAEKRQDPDGDDRPGCRKEGVHETAARFMSEGVTALVRQAFPEARWVWETPDPVQEILLGGDAYILLDHAGGYRRARVICRNLQPRELDFKTDRGMDVPMDDLQDTPEAGEKDYGLLAFEWVGANLPDLERRCREASAQGKEEVLVPSEELPSPESWEDICRELERQKATRRAETSTDGIIMVL